MDKRGARANAVSGQMRLPEDSTKPEEMTDEQLRLAIAELAGWKREELLVFRAEWEAKDRVSGGAMDEAGVPDYLDDLNAVHEVEELLTDPAEFTEYGEALSRLLNDAHRGEPRWLGPTSYHYAHATARQRCIALVRVLGKKRHLSKNATKSSDVTGASNLNQSPNPVF